MENMVIIGSGPAGCTAAIYAARAGLNPLVLEGGLPGGQLTQTTDVENYPGFVDGINGFDLVVAMKRQAERFGARFEMDSVENVDFSNPKEKKIKCADFGEISAKCVVIATGASARYLGLANEEALIGHGVSGCATCDGAFFRNKPVAVVGGGDTACEDALYLARMCSHVFMIHRRDALRASKVMANRVLENPKITMLWDSAVEEIFDVNAGKVTSISVRNLKTQLLSTVVIDGLFVAIGHKPNTDCFSGALPLDSAGYIATLDGCKTIVDGVFAAGDVQDPFYKQAIIAAGAGCRAALEAERYLVVQD